jgi:hypothetical protein
MSLKIKVLQPTGLHSPINFNAVYKNHLISRMVTEAPIIFTAQERMYCSWEKQSSRLDLNSMK